MLVIEVDGITHAEATSREKDEVRQKAIESEGFNVIRFFDDDVLHNLKGVHLFLENWIDDFEKITPRVKNRNAGKRHLNSGPPPTPSRGGQDHAV